MDASVLWALHQGGDAESRTMLIERYSPMAANIARRMPLPVQGTLDAEDLESAGLIGLISAVDNFQPDRGVPFEAYAALRIRGAMLDELRAMDQRGRRNSDQERESAVSLDQLLELGEHRLPISDDRGAEMAVDRFKERVERAVRYLPDRQREVLARYYGDSLTLREAGARMGVSEARACQIHGRAIASLRLQLFATASASAA